MVRAVRPYRPLKLARQFGVSVEATFSLKDCTSIGDMR